ncbi:MAG: hypothetical protein SFW35_01930 [Chitinophagales bacterium]|nr:hypothetical protein [Chitinophagales bacterium]
MAEWLFFYIYAMSQLGDSLPKKIGTVAILLSILFLVVELFISIKTNINPPKPPVTAVTTGKVIYYQEVETEAGTEYRYTAEYYASKYDVKRFAYFTTDFPKEYIIGDMVPIVFEVETKDKATLYTTTKKNKWESTFAIILAIAFSFGFLFLWRTADSGDFEG